MKIQNTLLVLATLFIFVGSPLAAEEIAVNDVARILGGLPLSPGSPLTTLESQREWTTHANQLGKKWSQLEEKRLRQMRSWQEQELQPQLPASDTLYYMFGGPDVLSAITLFPRARTLILAGLEPPGDVAVLNRLPTLDLKAELPNLAQSISKMIELSFFRTRDLELELARGKLTGVLPLLLVFLARTENTVLQVRAVSIDSSGELLDSTAVAASEKKGTVPGLEITFRSAKGGEEKTLYYFKVNLLSYYLRQKPGFLHFLAAHGPGIGLLKAASYLLHEEYCADIRAFLLEHSNAVLQDDSGIPYRFFEKGRWDLLPYGSYTTPIPSFAKEFQADLKTGFKGAKPLPFSIGYRFKNDSNLLLALRRLAQQ